MKRLLLLLLFLAPLAPQLCAASDADLSCDREKMDELFKRRHAAEPTLLTAKLLNETDHTLDALEAAGKHEEAVNPALPADLQKDLVHLAADTHASATAEPVAAAPVPFTRKPKEFPGVVDALKSLPEMHSFESKVDGTKLVYSVLSPEVGPKKALVIAQGKGESVYRYLEFAQEMKDRGYGPILMLDHRSQGFSEQKLAGAVHVNKFDDYVKDFIQFMDGPVKTELAERGITEKPNIVGHSLGGTILKLAVAQRPDLATAGHVGYISPMFEIKMGPLMERMHNKPLEYLSGAARYLGLNDYTFGADPQSTALSGLFRLDNAYALERAMNIRTPRQSVAWANEALKAGDLARDTKASPEVPAIIFQGKRDKLINNSAIQNYACEATGCTLIEFNGSHALHDEAPAIRQTLEEQLDSFFQGKNITPASAESKTAFKILVQPDPTTYNGVVRVSDGVSHGAKFAVFQGDFSPPSEAEVKAVRESVAKFGFDEVLLLPGANTGKTPAEQRALAAVAFASVPQARLPSPALDRELRGQPYSAAVDFLAARNPLRKVTSLSGEAALKDPHFAESKAANVRFGLIGKTGDENSSLVDDFVKAKGLTGKVDRMETDGNLSSDSIRAAIARGEQPEGMPPEVANFLAKRSAPRTVVPTPASQFHSTASMELANARHSYFSGNLSLHELDRVNAQYGLLETPVIGTSESARRIGYLRQEKGFVDRSIEQAMAEKDSAKAASLSAASKAVSGQLAKETRAREVVLDSDALESAKARRGLVDSITAQNSLDRYQSEFPGRSLAQVRANPADDSLLRAMQARDAARESVTAMEITPDAVTPNAAVWWGKVEKSDSVSAATRQALAEGEVPTAARSFDSVLGDLRAQHSAIQADAAALMEKAKADPSLLKSVQEAQKAEAVTADHIATLTKNAETVKAPAALTAADEKLANDATGAALSFLRQANEETLGKLGLEGLAAKPAATGADRFKLYEDFKVRVAAMPAAKRGEVVSAVRDLATKGKGDFAHALSTATDAKPLVKALERADEVAKAGGAQIPGAAHAVMKAEGVKPADAALAAAVGAAPGAEKSGFERKANSLARTKALNAETAKLRAANRAPASVAQETLKGSAEHALAGMSVAKRNQLVESFAKVAAFEKNETNARAALDHFKALTASPDMLETYRLSYVHAAEELAGAKSWDQAWEAGVKKMLVESKYTPEEIEKVVDEPSGLKFYQQTARCLRI